MRKENKAEKLFRNKNLNKMSTKQNEKYVNQGYRPDTEVKLTGEEFMILQRALEEIRKDRLIAVQVNVDGKVHQGTGLAERDMDIEHYFGFVLRLHRKNIDAGLTVPFSVLEKELKKEQAEVKSEPVAEKTEEVTEQPSSTSVVVETPDVVATQSEPEVINEKKVVFKEEKVENKEE